MAIGAPTSKRAILGKLRMRGGLTPDVVGVEMSFTPSLAIMAARIDKLGLDIRSFREPLKRSIQKVMIPSFRANFAQGGRPDAWEPLSDSTIEIRERLGFGGGDTVLVRTGALAKTMGQLNIWTITKTTAIIKDLPSRVWYGAIQQAGYEGGSMRARIKKHGGDAAAAFESLIDDQKHAMRTGTKIKTVGAATIPARPFALFQDEDEDAITEVFIAWMDERIARTWGTL